MAGSAPYKRTAVTAAAAAIAFAAFGLIGPGTSAAVAGDAVTPQTAGSAQAIATSYKVNPTEAALSIGIGFGISLAAYTNQVAQAESRGIDLGIIGSTLAGEGCDGGAPTMPADQQPQPLRADSRTTTGGTQTENEKYVPAISKSVLANATPYSEANTTTAPLSGTGALASIAGAHSRAVTQVTKGAREAVATVDITGVSIAGVAELSGLHWSAVYRTGATEATDGAFTIGALKVLGNALPTGDPKAAVDAANTLLAPLGVALTLPVPHVSAGILFVDPMMVKIYPSPTRDSITGAIIGNPGVQQTREQLYAALLAQDCSNATYITVSDIAVGSVTGAGSLSLELGGVQAVSGALKTTNFLTGLPPLANDVLGNDLGAFTSGGDVGTALGELPPTAANPPQTILRPGRRPALVAVGKGSRGGKMALVGLLGLAGLLLVADRDRRLMRRAQRSTEG
jgi:hypothetical protein